MKARRDASPRRKKPIANQLVALNLDPAVERIAAGLLLQFGDSVKRVAKEADGSCLIETELGKTVIQRSGAIVRAPPPRAPEKMNVEKIEVLLTHVESLSKPNFLQAQLALLELGAQPVHFKRLQTLMEKSFKLPPFDPRKSLEEQKPFNATQFHLGLEAESLENPGLRALLEKNYALTPLDGLNTAEGCLDFARMAEKPNFTQILLRLQEIGVGPRSWCALRQIMEEKFSLISMDKFI